MAHRVAHGGRRTGWPTGGGGPECEKSGTVPHGPPPVSSFVASFRGASAGRGRRTSGVDGTDVGHGTCRVKEIYREKGNIFETGPAHGISQENPRISLRKAARRAALSRALLPLLPPRPTAGRAGDQSRPARPPSVALDPGSSLRSVRGSKAGRLGGAGPLSQRNSPLQRGRPAAAVQAASAVSSAALSRSTIASTWPASIV